MRHARPDDLALVAPLLEKLRAIDGLKERTPGSFYFKSKGFLHFHEHEGEILADVKEGGDWVRLSAGKRDWPALVKKVKSLVG